jgi:tol-pal system protein YbgF
MKEDIGLRTKTLEEKGKTSEEKNRILEEQTKVLGEKTKGIEDRLKGLEEKMAELTLKLKEAEKIPSTKEVPPEGKGVSTGAGDLYKDAYETFQKGNLEGARRKFEAFLKQYPNTELSDNAQFWIGETYYLKKDFDKAILAYENVIAKYPEGDKVPAALFKQALAFLELKDKTNARNLLKRVIEKYPHTEQAEMAKKRLDAIK